MPSAQFVTGLGPSTEVELHLFENGANRWVDLAAWPPSPKTGAFYLGREHARSPRRPAGTASTRTSWYGADHALLQPSHPFTEASRQPVTPGVTTRYDIALLANFALLPAGSRLQLVLNSQAGLAGGVYTVELSADAPSFINVPLAAPDIFRTSGTDWGPSS